MTPQTLAASRRLLILSTDLAVGGAEVQLVRLAMGMQERGWSVSVVSMLPPNEFVGLLGTSGIRVADLGMKRRWPDPRGALRLARILKAERPAVLVSFMFHANVLARLVGAYALVPVVVSSIRNERFGGRHRERLLRLTDFLADITVVNSADVGESLVQRGVVPASKIQVIPNAVGESIFGCSRENRQTLRASLGIGEADFMWLTVGRSDEQKDYENLLTAFKIVADKEPSAVLCVAGRGTERVPRQISERLGLSARCRMLGFRRDAEALLDACDAFVLASSWEGMPNSLMEAAAAGKPVVATRVGGARELVLHGESGVLVERRQPEALAGAMVDLMRQPEEVRVAMGLKGRSRVAEEYAVDKIVKRWEDLLLDLHGRKGQRK